jgi:mannose-6-phosphate isomerase-like protein (cupin superfamily)
MDLAVTLNDAPLHLDAGHITVANREVLRERPELARGHYISVFSYEAAWGYRERHPDGDELVYALAGHATMELVDDADRREVRIAAGVACVVPTGAWHRLVSGDPCTLLFITPAPANTEHETVDSRN